jgi:hypothetical protein
VGPAREVGHGATRHFRPPVPDVAGVRHKGDIARSAEARSFPRMNAGAATALKTFNRSVEGTAPARSDAAQMAPCRQSAGNLQLLYTPFLDLVVEGAFHVAGDPLAEGV